MADTDDKKEEKAAVEKKDEPQKVKTKIGIVTWAILAVIVILCAGSGFFLGRLFARSSSPESTKSSQENPQTEKAAADNSEPNSGTWYYNDLESIVVNPDEPGATRFVRVGLILEINPGLSKEKAKEFIEAKKPLLINWLNLYFKSLTLDRMKNDEDMKRILSQTCDAFNEILFPDAKPQIKGILIREFNIQ
jgi:flagellar basal body-associated protein FliL